VSDEDEIRFIASRFSEVESLSDLGVHNLRRVLAHPSLRIESEDSLYNFISSQIERDESFTELLEFIHFEFLSAECVDRFISSSPSFIFDHLNLSLWNSLCRRLSLKATLDSSFSEAQTRRFGRVIHEDELRSLTEERDRLRSRIERVFTYNSSNPFDGIISQLRRECNGNVHQKDVVNITSSGDDTSRCYNLVDYGWRNYWCSTNQENSWVCFDFKEKKVCLSGYTLKSDGRTGGYRQFLNWTIHGSNDGRSWSDVLDSQDTAVVNGVDFMVRHFDCPRTDRSYRFIRIQMRGKNNFDNYKMKLSEVEFFGTLSRT
jgi:hypothetical protein